MTCYEFLIMCFSFYGKKSRESIKFTNNQKETGNFSKIFEKTEDLPIHRDFRFTEIFDSPRFFSKKNRDLGNVSRIPSTEPNVKIYGLYQ